jgi:hypothetical protein
MFYSNNYPEKNNTRTSCKKTIVGQKHERNKDHVVIDMSLCEECSSSDEKEEVPRIICKEWGHIPNASSKLTNILSTTTD